MTTGTATRSAGLRDAMLQSAHAEAIAPLLAPGVVLHSPILTTAFEGREMVAHLLSVVNDTVAIDHCTHQLTDGSAEMLVFDDRIGGHPLQATILIEFDDDGRARQIDVFFRPLRAMAAFIAATGPQLAKSPGAARLMRALGPGMPLMAAGVDGLARRAVRFR
jgi:hypothetical protein